METEISNIPGKMRTTWREDVKAVVDTWETYLVTLEEFKQAVLVKGVDYAKTNGGVAWIVDSSAAKGVFTPQIQEFIGSDVFPMFAKIGVKYFITISSKVSNLTNLTVNQYAAKTGPCGLQLIELNSVTDAITWLKFHAK